MLYGVANPDARELIIAAADSFDEQQQFLNHIEGTAPEIVQDTDFTRYLKEPALRAYRRPPTILEFPTRENLDTFVRNHSITVVENQSGADRQNEMLTRLDFDLNDQRTIADIYGIPKEAFDVRGDEKKEKDAKMRQAQERGDITGSSFDEAENHGGLAIHGWGKPIVHEDGTVEFGDILADKDMFSHQTRHLVITENGTPDAYRRVLDRAGLLHNPDNEQQWWKHPSEEGVLIKTSEGGYENLKNALAEFDHTFTLTNEATDDVEATTADEQWQIADDFLVSIYYRVDLPNGSLALALTALARNKLREPYVSREVEGFGSWLAYVRESDARKVMDALNVEGFEGEVVAVDPFGARILEEGVEGATVLDMARHDEEPPLPWNDEAEAFHALSPEDQQKRLQGKYFLYTTRRMPRPMGVIIHIAPKSYFRDHERIWEGELDLSHMLAPNLDRYGDVPGVYQCTSLDEDTVGNLLSHFGMKESLMLRAYANFLPDFDQRKLKSPEEIEE